MNLSIYSLLKTKYVRNKLFLRFVVLSIVNNLTFVVVCNTVYAYKKKKKLYPLGLFNGN